MCGQQHTLKNIYITNYYSSSEIILHFRCCISSLAIAKLVVFNSSLFFLLNEDACNYFYANFEYALQQSTKILRFFVLYFVLFKLLLLKYSIIVLVVELDALLLLLRFLYFIWSSAICCCV